MSFFSSLRSQRGASSMSVILGAVIVAVIIAVVIATHGFGTHPKTMSASSDGQVQEGTHMGQ